MCVLNTSGWLNETTSKQFGLEYLRLHRFFAVRQCEWPSTVSPCDVFSTLPDIIPFLNKHCLSLFYVSTCSWNGPQKSETLSRHLLPPTKILTQSLWRGLLVCFEKKAQPGPTSMRCGRRNFSMFGDAFQGSIVWLSQVKGNRESDILILGYVVIVMVAFLDDLCIKIQGMGSFPKADALQLESRLGTWPCNRMICAFSFPRLIYHQWWHLCQNTGKQWETRWNPSSLEANSALKGTQLQQLRTYKEARWHSKARGLKIWSWLGDLERLILANGVWMSWFPPHSTDSFAQWCWQAKSTQEPGEDMAFAEGGFLGDSLNHHEGRRVQCKV